MRLRSSEIIYPVTANAAIQAAAGSLGVVRSAVAALSAALVPSLPYLLSLHILVASLQSMSSVTSSVTEALSVSIPEHSDAWLALGLLTTRTHWTVFPLVDACLLVTPLACPFAQLVPIVGSPNLLRVCHFITF